MRVALTIGGSDSSSGAGVQADLKTFAAFGLYGVSVVTAITAQSTQGVEATSVLPADLVTAQIEALSGDLPLQSVKTGMLGSAAIVEAVAASIEELDLPFVVVDPVMSSSGGVPLLDVDGVQALARELLPRAYVVTPNIPEAEALSGIPIRNLGDSRRAAERIGALGAGAVIVTGGHAPGLEVIDLLFDGRHFVELRTERVGGPRVHGTGCAFSSALAAGLAESLPLPEAAAQAQRYVAGAMADAHALGRGALLLDHFWNAQLRAKARR